MNKSLVLKILVILYQQSGNLMDIYILCATNINGHKVILVILLTVLYLSGLVTALYSPQSYNLSHGCKLSNFEFRKIKDVIVYLLQFKDSLYSNTFLKGIRNFY